MAPIMILWGIVTVATMYIRTPVEFYTARIILDAPEADVFQV
jgi:hypothetical protein